MTTLDTAIETFPEAQRRADAWELIAQENARFSGTAVVAGPHFTAGIHFRRGKEFGRIPANLCDLPKG
jgi:hypothetical protein